MNLLDQIVDYSDVFSEEEMQNIKQVVYSPRWEITNSDPSNGERTYWRMNLMDIDFFTNRLFDKIKKVINKDATLQDVYLNGTTTSMATTAHIDAKERDVYVMLVYLNPDWHIQWGGQTIFLNSYFDPESGEIKGNNTTKVYFPKFNTGLLFPGTIIHMSEAPTREFYGLRLTLAYRFKVNE